MTVQELKLELENYNDDDEVMISYPSGDYWGRQIARGINLLSDENVVWSEYHRTYKLVDGEDSEGDSENIKNVVMLS